RVRVVLAAIASIRVALAVARAVHVDRRDAEVMRALRRIRDAAAAIDRPVQFDVRGPAVLHALGHQARERPVQPGIGAVLPVQPALRAGAGGHVLHFVEEGNAALDQRFSILVDGFGVHRGYSSERKPDARTTGPQASRSLRIEPAYSCGG